MPMTEPMVKRICLILPMLGSSNEGEAMNTVRALNRILTDANVHWTEVASRLLAPPSASSGHDERMRKPGEDYKRQYEERMKKAEQPQPRRKKSAWLEDKEDIEKIFVRRGECDEWSYEFLESIHDQVVGQGRSLTEKQRNVLNGLLDKLGA